MVLNVWIRISIKKTYQCCGSGMFIPDPGSWFLPIPDPGSNNRNKREGWKKNCHLALKNMGLGSGIRKKRIPDPGSRGQKGTGSRIRMRIRNNETCSIFLCVEADNAWAGGHSLHPGPAGADTPGRPGPQHRQHGRQLLPRTVRKGKVASPEVLHCSNFLKVLSVDPLFTSFRCWPIVQIILKCWLLFLFLQVLTFCSYCPYWPLDSWHFVQMWTPSLYCV